MRARRLALCAGVAWSLTLGAPARAEHARGTPAAAPVQAGGSGRADGGPATATRTRYPGYLAGGILSLAVGVGFAAGGVVAAATSNPDTALGLSTLGTTAAAVGAPMLLLGATSDRPASSSRAAAGIALATGGVIGLGLGAMVLERRLASEDDPAVGVPLVILGAGTAAAIAGLVLWSSGAGEAEGDGVALRVGPTGAAVSGRW